MSRVHKRINELNQVKFQLKNYYDVYYNDILYSVFKDEHLPFNMINDKKHLTAYFINSVGDAIIYFTEKLNTFTDEVKPVILSDIEILINYKKDLENFFEINFN